MFKTHLIMMFSILSTIAYYLYVTALAQKKASFAQKLGIFLAVIIGLIALVIGVKFLVCTVSCYFLGGCHYGR
jgi:multisubunit Na+/H+ antiporter MnhB subunit